MAEESLIDKFGSFFRSGDLNDPRVNSQLRQRIALQMMTQGKKGYPKTLGEGLTAIGDSLGDIGMARQLAASDIAGQEQATRAVAQPATAPVMSGAPIMNYAPDEGGEAYQPAPQQPVQQAAPPPQASVLPDQAAPPVVAGPPPETGLPPAQPPPAETYTPPTPEQVNSSRNALTRGLLARQPAAGGPPPNPMLAGAVPASISTAVPSPSPEPDLGSRPDPRLALNAPPQDARGAVTDIRPAPPMPSQIRQAPSPQQMAQAQQSYPPGYVPPEPGRPAQPPTIGMTPRELQLRRLIAQNPGNPYYATAAAPELATLTQDREKRQAYSDKMFEAEIARGTTQASKRLDAQTGHAKAVQDWLEGQQKLISGGAGAVPVAGSDQRLGTPASPQRTGIPTAPPVPPGSTPDKWALEQAPRMAKAVDAVEKATPQFDDMLKTLKLAREHPGREWGVGAVSEFAKKTPGTSAYGFGKIMDQIGGKNFLNAYQQLKGAGAITEVEGTKAEAAQARLATAQTKEDWNRAMIDFETAVRQDMETIQRKVNRPVSAWRPPGDNESYAPDVGERRGDKEYTGGNPRDPMNWRRVQ